MTRRIQLMRKPQEVGVPIERRESAKHLPGIKKKSRQTKSPDYSTSVIRAATNSLLKRYAILLTCERHCVCTQEKEASLLKKSKNILKSICKIKLNFASIYLLLGVIYSSKGFKQLEMQEKVIDVSMHTADSH